MANTWHTSLFLSGQDQVLTIPHEFSLASTEVLLRKEGHRLIIEPVRLGSLLALLTTLPDITDPFSDLDEGLLPLDEVML